MKAIKKLLALLLALSMVLCLFACRIVIEKDDEDEDEEEEETEAEKDDKDEDKDETKPDGTQPENEPENPTSAPTLPAPSIPEASIPEPTIPEPTIPEPTIPEPTIPETPVIPIEPVVEPSFLDQKYVLTEVAQFADNSKIDFADVLRESVYVEGTSNTGYLYSYDGKSLISINCRYYDYYGNGIAVLYVYENEVPTAHLVNIDTGEQIFTDTDAGFIEPLSDRYYYVTYLTEETTESDDFFVVYYDKDRNKKYFNGYGRIYDMDNRRLVPNLTITDPSSTAVYVRGEHLLVNTGTALTYQLYDANGLPKQTFNNVITTDISIMQETYAELKVYDKDFNLIKTMPNTRAISDSAGLLKGRGHASDYSHKYFLGGEYQAYTVIDINGNQIIPGTYKRVRAYNDYLIVTDSNDQESMYLGDGTLLVSGYKYLGSLHNVPSILRFSGGTDGSQEFLYIPGYGLRDVTGYTYDSYGNFYTGDYTTGKTYLTLFTGKTQSYGDTRSSSYGFFLMVTDYGVVETLTGSVLLEKNYDQAVITDEYLYARYGTTWKVYRYDLVTV